ncbi:MAG TPA: hypothetical protein DEQ32_09910 [Gammaproteobacteria bacterium]|nr:hypothetical protein [Gammaproteobacteria bacterium]
MCKSVTGHHLTLTDSLRDYISNKFKGLNNHLITTAHTPNSSPDNKCL